MKATVLLAVLAVLSGSADAAVHKYVSPPVQ